MFYSRALARTSCAALALAALIVSCSRNHRPAFQRLAILRFENLTGDDSLNWTGRAASEVLAAELAGSRTADIISFAAGAAPGARPRSAPGISTEQSAALLSGADRIVYGRVSQTAGTLLLNASVFDVARRKIGRAFAVEAAKSEGIIKLADALARQMGAPVRPFETQNTGALRDYCAALEASDPAATVEAFSRATRSDPNFGQAYVVWAEFEAARHNIAEVERILGLAAAEGGAISELNRVRLEALAAELRGDTAARTRALAAVSRLNPADIGLLRQLSQANLNSRRYPEAAENLKNALALDPEETTLLNQLGYVEMYAGNLPEAAKAIERYVRLRPADPNALDSLGDINFYFGEFAGAEKYYRESFDKDAGFNQSAALMKAAYARLMTGDSTGADGIFSQYSDARRKAGDGAVAFLQAEWEFLSGRRRQGIARMEAFARIASSDPKSRLASEAYSQLAVWELEMGDRARGRDFALRAQTDLPPVPIARFLTERPVSPAEWSVRAQQLMPSPAQDRTRKLALGYALLLQNELQAAQPLFADLYQHSAPGPQETLPVLLAWTLEATGRFKDAAGLMDRNPIPSAAPDIFASLAFPRLFFLRGVYLDKLGRHGEAVMNYRLFLKLSGPDTKQFGEEAAAERGAGR